MRFYPGADGAVAGAVARERVLAGGRHRWSLTAGELPTTALVLAGVAGVIATIATVVFTIRVQPGSQLAAVGRGAVVAIPVAVGVYACRRGPYPRFAWLLLSAALLWSVVGLAQSAAPLPYSIGRVAEWLVEPLVILVVLAFPSGRLPGVRERAVVFTALAIAGILYVPTALLIARYPVPAPWTSCTSQCPHNAFMLLSHQPAFVGKIVQPTREILTQVVFLTMVVLVIRRARTASLLIRRAQGPVLVVAAIRFASLTGYLMGRRAGLSDTALAAVGWIWLVSLPGIAVGFLWGMLRWRLFAADTLQRLASSHRTTGDDMSGALAMALEDPTLRVLYQVDTAQGEWVTESGEPAELPQAHSAQDVTEIIGSRGHVLAIVHDKALSEIRPVVQAAAAQVAVGLENDALAAEVKSSLRDLAESRGRIVAAGNDERRRIEQNLHDGAQQRLIVLLFKLQEAGQEIERDPALGKRAIQGLVADVELVIAEIRALARGIYPSVLTDLGIVSALQSSAATASLPMTIQSNGIGRYSAEVEACVYFTCIEALQNAYKHASGATAITISLTEHDCLEFEVCDDGAGFDPDVISAGTGIASMHDRVAAVRGRVTIESGSGGTRLSGRIPIRQAAAL